jgi:hypothetical protein
MASGRAKLERINTLRANIAAGEVAIGDIAGRAIIGGSTVTMRVGHTSADLALSSGSGGLDIDRADGNVTVTTGDAAIRIRRLTRGRAELINRSGTIEIGIAEGTAAQVDISSERGSVRNSASSPEGPGSLGDEVTVQARSRYGDIVVQAAAS